MQAVILVGGKGTRLSFVLEKMNLPKPMVPVLGKPFLEYLLSMLKKKGVRNFIFCTGHQEDKIKEYFGDGKNFGIGIRYSHEEYPLYSAGALKQAEELLEDDFLVINGDNYHDIDFSALFSFHKNSGSSITIATTTPSKITEGMSAHIFSENNVVREYYGKENNSKKNFAITGTFVVNKKVLEELQKGTAISLENDLIPEYIKKMEVFSFNGEGYYLDIGTPERYEKFIEDVRAGIISL
ncbi:nucleotidyltransferase family protein [Candidatus Pacearchaeota archaeon]|nr:nucleotidyltransferase family protein [Candidatus Pacearchaeota archaeon]